MYATNGFAVINTDSSRTIERVSSPTGPSNVVVDISALLTLHQLGRLKTVVEHFGCLVLPATYGDLKLRDAGKYGQHQPSREQELRRVLREVDRGKITIATSPMHIDSIVDEYRDEAGGHAYRLRDLIAPLKDARKASSTEIEELFKVAHKPITADSSHPPFAIGAAVLVNLATLRTLAGFPVFDAVLDGFRVHLTEKQRDDALQELRAHDDARAAKTIHDSLWNEVSEFITSDRVKLVPVPRFPDVADDDDVEPGPIHLDSLHVAKETCLPLIADDRVLQVMMSAEQPASCRHAFGSDIALESAVGSKNYSLADFADDFHKLIRWRYRFLMPPAEVLAYWASKERSSLPGDALLDVAQYLHDCLRDPGLHCGPEESEPPMPIAVKLLTTWNEVIADFLCAVLGDDSFSNDQVAELARWVGEDLVPSVPRGLWFQLVGLNAGRIEARSMLSMAMVKVVAIKSSTRANLALKNLANAMGLDDDDFLEIAAEVMHGIRR